MNVDYKITVTTDDEPGNGTDANVYLTLVRPHSF